MGNDLDLEVSPDTGLIPDMVTGSINGISGVVNFEMQFIFGITSFVF